MKNPAASCEFGDLKDQLTCDRITFLTINKMGQERLLREQDLDLDRAINIAQTVEILKLLIQQLEEQSTMSEVIKNAAKRKPQWKRKSVQQNRHLTGTKACAGDVAKFMKVENSLHMV